MTGLTRHSNWTDLTATITDTLATCTAIEYSDWAGGSIALGTTSQTSLAVYGAKSTTGTFRALLKVDGTAVTIAKADLSDGIYPIPDEAFGCKAIKFVGIAAGPDTAEITLKG